MEFPSIVFFTVSYCISSICYAVGFVVLASNSDLSNAVIFAVAYWMFLFILISSAYAFLIRPSLENGPPYMQHVPLDVMRDGMSQSLTRLEQACPRVMNLVFSLFNKIITMNGNFNRLGTWTPFEWIYGIWKIMKFALGMVGTILFQYYFKFASTHQLVVFLCFAVTWLGNLAMVQPWTDVGIFNFLIVNACLGGAVNLFSVDIRTWGVFAACILLCFLREKLDSVIFKYDRGFRVTRHEQDPVIPQTLPLSSIDIDDVVVVVVPLLQQTL